MKVLITGGSGFLGINMIRHLLGRGVTDITSLDIAPFDYPEKDLIKVIKGDIRHPDTVKAALAGIDCVIHTAAALPLYSPPEIFSTEVAGTRILLEEAYRNRIKRFIHISSTAVYGVPDHHPLYEDDKLDGVGPYGEAKIEAEQVCWEYRKKGMCIPIIRPKSFVGPERLGVFAIFYEWAQQGKNFPMIGNGRNRYQLLDVEDLCESIYLCLTGDREIVNDTYNVGAAVYAAMREDYQAVLDCAGFGKKIICFPAGPTVAALRILEILRLSPLYKWIYATAAKDSFVSVEKAVTKLGFHPKYSNRDALVRNYKWYRDNYAGAGAGRETGISHRLPWKQSALKVIKFFF